jgi:prolyl-tRNA synthetase
MGGLGAHEYMAPCPAGENEIVLAPGYAANVEVATADPKPVDLPEPPPAPRLVPTPGLVKVEEVAEALSRPPGALLKAFPVEVGADRRLVLALVRGDHRVNELKLAAALGAEVRPAAPERVAAELGPPGFLGPVGIDGKVEVLLDRAVGPGGYVTGANQPDAHLEGVVPGRDFAFRTADIRRVEEGDTVGGHPVRIEPAIEIANIFKLGTRYSEPLGARYLDERSQEREVWMGSYGIGPARIVAAAVEQYADERGISWPREIAPFQLHLIALGKAGSEERRLADRLYDNLQAAGFTVLYDDREVGAGEKFTDAELLGLPLRLVVGRKAREEGVVEVVGRRGLRHLEPLPVEAAGEELRSFLDRAWQEVP